MTQFIIIILYYIESWFVCNKEMMEETESMSSNEEMTALQEISFAAVICVVTQHFHFPL